MKLPLVKILSKLTLLTSILLILFWATAIYQVVDTYQRYGWSWEVTTIVDGKNETHTENLSSHLLVVGFVFVLAAVNLANYWEFTLKNKRRVKSEV